MSTLALVRAGEEQAPRWVAADRCSAAAARAGDPVAVALAADHRASVHAHAGFVTEARDTLMAAIDTLAPVAEAYEHPAAASPSPEPAAVWGSLLLDSARWAAWANDLADCHRLLRQADAMVPRVQRDDDLFGPTSAAVFRVGCAVDLGDLADALRLGAAIDTSHLEGVERSRPAGLRVRIAAAHAMRAQDADALLWLLDAERLAPEWVRGGRVEVNDMVGTMLRRERGRRPGLRELAGRVGVLD